VGYQGEHLDSEAVLKLLDRGDTTEISRYLTWLANVRREEWIAERYADQDFSGWDKYHTWLMARWEADRDNAM